MYYDYNQTKYKKVWKWAYTDRNNLTYNITRYAVGGKGEGGGGVFCHASDKPCLSVFQEDSVWVNLCDLESVYKRTRACSFSPSSCRSRCCCVSCTGLSSPEFMISWCLKCCKVRNWHTQLASALGFPLLVVIYQPFGYGWTPGACIAWVVTHAVLPLCLGQEQVHMTDWLNFYYTRIEVKAQMPVEQPVLDTNYKHLKVIRTWQKTTIIKTIITIAIIVAYRGENKIKCLWRKHPPQKKTKNRVVGGGGGEVNREQNN